MTKLNIIIDSSGSMEYSTFQEIQNIINYYDKFFNLNIILCDTNAKPVLLEDLEKELSKPGGGTFLQRGIDFIVDNLNDYETIIFSDGFDSPIDGTKLKNDIYQYRVGKESIKLRIKTENTYFDILKLDLDLCDQIKGKMKVTVENNNNNNNNNSDWI